MQTLHITFPWFPARYINPREHREKKSIEVLSLNFPTEINKNNSKQHLSEVIQYLTEGLILNGS